jgi:hypothetical protein
MNRSILIVICDFLLVSLLAFSTVDINKVSDANAQRQLRTQIATNRVDSGKDLANVMRLALDDERRSREQLMGELAKSKQEAAQQQAVLEQRDQKARQLEQALQMREQEAARLQETQTNLQQRFTAAQASIQALNQQLQNSSSEAVISREKLASLDAELRRRMADAAALQSQVATLARSNELSLNERQQLASQLAVAQAERRDAQQQASRMQEQVKAEREEKARLAESVKTLATRSGELAKEVRENRPLAPNTIFNDFVSNRVDTRFTAYRSGLLGSDKTKITSSVLVTDGANTFALCHVQETPFTFWNPGVDWESLTCTLGHNAVHRSVAQLSFHYDDPRIIVIPVSAEQVRELGCKVYKTSADPYKFQDAVLVGAREGYYGECGFQIELDTPNYVKLDRNLLKGLFGKFNPLRGDLVFSRTGELLGVMANSSYCLMVRNFELAATFQLGQDMRTQRTGGTLARFYNDVVRMPMKLQ